MGITIKKAWGHFRTITRHRHLVIRHCKKAGILWHGLRHDLSKYTPTEFLAGARYYTNGTKSPNEKEREIYGYSPAWLHHKGRNRHHFEYWNDYSPKAGRVVPVPMPLRYVKELVCDRIAASKIYQGENYTRRHPLDYYLRGDANRFIAPETSALVTELLTLLAEEGEDAVFARLKAMQ